VDAMKLFSRPTGMLPAIFISHRNFDRVWTLALSGLLKHAYMVLTPPRYQSAYVLNISFSTHTDGVANIGF
jgi:hypothetical protein